MKKIQILITIAFIFSIISLNAYAAKPEVVYVQNIEQDQSAFGLNHSGQISIQPKVQPNVQPQEQPNVQPQEQPKAQPQEQQNEQDQVQPIDQPQVQPNVQPQEQPNVQPQEQPNVQPQKQPNVQPQEQPNVQPQEQQKAQPQEQLKEKHKEKHKDPIKHLEKKKENIKKELKEGKITRKEADELTEKIDKRIARIKEFNRLPLPEKKAHLSSKFKSRIEQAVKDGKISKEEADKLQADFNKNLESWDGKGYPKLMHKDGNHKQ